MTLKVSAVCDDDDDDDEYEDDLVEVAEGGAR